MSNVGEQEELPVKEPMLFGKRVYLEGLLLKVMQTPTGTRLFVEKKLNKLNALSEAMEYQLTRISHFKGRRTHTTAVAVLQ